MLFPHDTDFSLRTAEALVNTAANGQEALADPAALNAFLRGRQESGHLIGSQAELREVVELRGQVREVWRAQDLGVAAGLVNGLLSASRLQPRLSDHDGKAWHVHLTAGDQPVAERMRAELSLALADVIRADAIDRLRMCDAPDCDAVLVDLSRNRSRRYCDTGNCGNRQHVAAYRARQASRDMASN